MQEVLNNIGEIILGHTFRGAIDENPNGNYSILQAKNVGHNGNMEASNLTRTILEEKQMRAIVRDQDVLLSNRGTFRAGVFSGKHQNVLAASSIYIIRIHDQNRCLPDYLAIYLNSDKGQNLLNNMNRGTVIKSLPKQSLSELLVPLPRIPAQRTIIDIHKNFWSRVELYERKLLLEKNIANQAISNLISQ